MQGGEAGLSLEYMCEEGLPVLCGDMVSLSRAGAGPQAHLQRLAECIRWSYGAGIVLRLGNIARLELNYCVPMGVQSGDRWENDESSSCSGRPVSAETSQNIFSSLSLSLLGYVTASSSEQEFASCDFSLHPLTSTSTPACLAEFDVNRESVFVMLHL